MLDVVAQDVVADNVCHLSQRFFKLVQPLFGPAFRREDGRFTVEPDRSDVEDPDGLRVYFQVDRQAFLQQRPSVLSLEAYEVEKSHQVQENNDLAASLEVSARRGNMASRHRRLESAGALGAAKTPGFRGTADNRPAPAS
ncbi:hypothetical protein [Tabrizicola soli]|uniref:Uncharacterized protein n=1 Tax=Tabrizicola soli TaxID=2185115 RepID=A0ABV7DXR3_9RHOB